MSPTHHQTTDTKPTYYHSKVDSAGRIVLPAPVRSRLHIAQGEELILVDAADGLHLMTLDQVLRNIQEEFASRIPPGVSLADELLAERRAEADAE